MRLLILVLILAAGWLFREPLGELLDRAMAVPPRVRTEMDMRGYRDGLVAFLERRKEPPGDLSRWLDERIEPHGDGQPASLDRYGNPYRVTLDRQRDVYVLRSCGPDGVCMTEDDLTVDLVPE
ncbi:MAG: hypothetical protein PVI57_08405 [Gemmatimonadota bacterium]|jgi:hypothetical protein